MKFGETLSQRSVPQWSTYNVNYNDIKHLIKQRTSTGGVATPQSIPTGSSQNRWAALEDELFVILKEQHDNVALFLRSKNGEIDRRLAFLEKQVASAQKVSQHRSTNSTLRQRRYQKLLIDADSLEEDIQDLARFASVQKTAFRKLLKKYRKWTDSTGLQIRLEKEVLSSGQLRPHNTQTLERVGRQRNLISEQLECGSLETDLPRPLQRRLSTIVPQSISAVIEISKSQQKGPIALDTALASIPYGRSSGSAIYWIHPDNIDEARALLQRYVQGLYKSKDEAFRRSSSQALTSPDGQSHISDPSSSFLAVFGNPQNLQNDLISKTFHPPLSVRWTTNNEASLATSGTATRIPSVLRLNIPIHDLLQTLNREDVELHKGKQGADGSGNLDVVQAYLAEHRDVLPLSVVQSLRSRYAGLANSSQVGMWVTLDEDVYFSDFNSSSSNEGHNRLTERQPFPHAIMHVRWELCHTPELVKAFDTSHLAEHIQDFTLETAAVYMVRKDLKQPEWKDLLDKDIRKLPSAVQGSHKKRGATRRNRSAIVSTSSGPSSSDGPTDSVFSIQTSQSTNTSIRSLEQSLRGPVKDLEPVADPPKSQRKKARIDANSPPPRLRRYWNEFDDGDEDVNPQEAYTIYVDPNQSLPGVETVSKAFGALQRSFGHTGSKVTSMFSRDSSSDEKRKSSERSRMLTTASSTSTSDLADSSDSDVDEPLSQRHASSFGTFTKPQSPSRSRYTGPTLKRRGSRLTARQSSLERMYFLFYTSMIIMSIVLLVVCGVLLSVGRKKARAEVDGAVIAGITTAEIFAVISMVLLWRRKTPLTMLHKGIVQIAIISVFVIGIGEIVALVNKKKS